MIPKTAGVFLTEKRLRAFLKCSEFYFLGGESESTIHLKFLQHLFEYIVSASIRRDIMDPLVLINKGVYRISKELNLENKYGDAVLDKIRRQAVLDMDELITIFPLSTYNPIYGPFEFDTRVHKTPIRLQASGLFRSSKNKTLHVVVFSPYTNEHDILNDPTIYLKLAALKDFVKPHGSGRAQCKVHIFGISSKENLVYTSMDTRESDLTALSQIESVVKLIEAGYHYPIIPCKYSCPLKSNCFVFRSNNE